MAQVDNGAAMVALQRAFQGAQQARAALIAQVAGEGPLQALQFQLPEWLQTRPLERIEAIEPHRLSGVAAHQGAVAALKDLHRRTDDEQSQRVRRYPGLLRFQPSSNPNASLAASIQRLEEGLTEFKARLHALTQGASNVQDLRFELLHQLSPHLFTMHFYRTPMLLEPQVRRIRFGWVAKRIIAKTDRDTVLSRLENALTNPGQAVVDMVAWQEHVAREYRAVQALPANAKLRIDRPGGLRPTAFIHFAEGHRRQVPANLPLLLAQPQPVEVVDLPPWQARAFPAAKGECLIPRLHLYRL
ncbi:DNA replication terminus site-binding protein [Ferrimonas gelatinilytica]|uniref:DNA replication terminus site-binding protein n=1 Tax=Ferrimonas gelatinilytica TaxID=1255257 RepID=A0ABP9RXB6_9GAMM